MSFKKTIIPLFICGIVLCLCSCAKEDEFEMPTLVLSESSVSFDKGVGERTISVTTNQNSWIASSPQEGDWLSLVQDGNVLKVKVVENKMGTERISHVIVNANGATGKIEVRQSAADVTLDVVPTAIYLPQSGGEKVVDVTTNTSAYDVVLSEEVTWLKIIKGDEEIKLVAERNDSYLNREVKLYAKSGNQTREIVVSQSGIQRFVLPINPGLPQDVHKIMEYELGRGSYLREYQSAMPAYGLEEMYTFITPSPIFTLMQYSSADGITPSQIITVGDGATAVEAVKDKAFAKFLADNGYVRSNSSSDREYVNDKELLALKVYISEKVGNQGVNLTFTPVMKQVGDYKTFDRLPYYPQIGALLFKDTSLGLWKYGNKWVVTNEFKKKLGDEGFSYLRSAGNTHYFVRERDHLLIAVLSVVDNNVPVLALLYNYDASVQGAGTKALKAQNKMVSNFVDATKALKF